MNPRELITIVRQIGGMMEAGVDILRITRVLRAQSENQRLLDLCDMIDRELTMGRGLADALSRAPDLFSPFAVSLIRQGEERNNLAAAFLRLAEFLQQEEDGQAPPEATVNSSSAGASRAATTSQTLPVADVDERAAQELEVGTSSNAEAAFQISMNAEMWWQRSLSVAASLLGALAAVSALRDSRIVPERWHRTLALSACAGVLAAWSRRNDAEQNAVSSAPISASINRAADVELITDVNATNFEAIAPSPVDLPWPDSVAAEPHQSTLMPDVEQDQPLPSRMEFDSGSQRDVASALQRRRNAATPRDEEDFD